MIKENNLGDKSKLYLILHEVGTLHSQESREVQIGWGVEQNTFIG